MKMYNYDGFADWLQNNHPDIYNDWCNEDSIWDREPQDYVRKNDMMVFREWIAEQEVDHCH
jgi:hypothetical protein